MGSVLGIATNVILVRYLLARLVGAGWPVRLCFLHIILMPLVILVGRCTPHARRCEPGARQNL
jgi:hypothetical protein